jgi:hypothetical protein
MFKTPPTTRISSSSRWLAILCLCVLFSAVSGYASSFSLTVAGSDNIYTAGGNAPLGCCNGLGPDTPADLAATFSAGPGQVLTFSSVTGLVGCAFFLTNGPDGNCFSPLNTDISSLNDLSGIQATNANMFLVGVFLGPGLPGSAPGTLDYNGTTLSFSQSSYSPQIGQVFFIGDGLTGTGSGTEQTFNVPAGATRLYLGFADGFFFLGHPNAYGDNVGSLSVDGSIGTATPEPAAWSMSMVGLLGIAVVVISRRKSRDR